MRSPETAAPFSTRRPHPGHIPPQAGKYKTQGVARHKDYSMCSVFFVALRVFGMLVWDVEESRQAQVQVSDVQQWRNLPLFPEAAQTQQARKKSRHRLRVTLS